jgi:hypothetical protein
MLSTYTKLLISLQQFQSLMIHRRRSSAPTGKGKIIYDETQLRPPALQSSGGKEKKKAMLDVCLCRLGQRVGLQPQGPP